MSPLPEHEKVKKQIADMFAFLAVELDVPMCRLGSTTFRREDLAKGLEPDECYYIQNEPAVRGKRTIDLPDDPPPDLVVEVELTSWSIDRMAIYASLGVPEVWRWRADRLAFLHLVDGQYRPAAMSLAFPWLASADVQRFVRVDTENETALLRSWRDWVRANGPAQG